MLNKNTIDAYHKITAPEGLKERIEARVQAEQSAVKRKSGWKMIWVPAMTAVAAAVVCLTVWAGGAGIGQSDNDDQIAAMRIGGEQSAQLMLESGEVLGSSQTVLDVYSGDTTDLNAMVGMNCGLLVAEEVPETEEQKNVRPAAEAVVFMVTAPEPVTFKADSEILSVYDSDNMFWSDLCSELVLEMDGELCVLLSSMGDREVFYIEMSTAEEQNRIEIVYDETAGRYLASCQKITGE